LLGGGLFALVGGVLVWIVTKIGRLEREKMSKEACMERYEHIKEAMDSDSKRFERIEQASRDTMRTLTKVRVMMELLVQRNGISIPKED
jgi:hypothetical protein